jgi:Zn-dependent M16 (insulinase) family peptidase
MLNVSALVSTFRENLRKSPTYLQDLVSKHFVNNKHHLEVTMTPDENYTDVSCGLGSLQTW